MSTFFVVNVCVNRLKSVCFNRETPPVPRFWLRKDERTDVPNRCSRFVLTNGLTNGWRAILLRQDRFFSHVLCFISNMSLQCAAFAMLLFALHFYQLRGGKALRPAVATCRSWCMWAAAAWKCDKVCIPKARRIAHRRGEGHRRGNVTMHR